MIIFFLILLFLYVVLGVLKIISDFNQPSINQPDYVRHPSITGFFFAFLLAPFFWWVVVRSPMPKELKMRNKKLKELERENKKMMKDISKK